MSKSKYFFGQPIFSQLIGLIKKDRIEALAGEHKTDHYCKKFNTFQHLITMSYGILSGCNSLREMCTGIVSYGDKITHCKFSYVPKRSTISDANSKRSYKVFEACYYDLLKRYSSDLSDSRTGIISDKKIFSIDSTTFSLFQPIFECVGRKATNGQSKGGIKSHQKLDLQMGIPVKVYNNHAREHDSVFIQQEDFLKENEIGVFDKAYNKYSAFAKWNTQNIFFVTRLKDNAKEELVEEFELGEATPNEVLRDAKIKLKYKEDNEIKEVELRLVSYYDTNKNRCFYFLSNLFDLEPQQIADLYKMRWKVELLFKKIKQNFPLQYFYGESQNAIQIQLWCTLIVLLLVTVMQKALKTKWAFSNLISLMQKHLFTYIKFTDFFDHMDKIMADIKFYNNKDEYIQPELEGLTV
jgi:hypothetical protein